jgi:carbamoyltransferase
MLVLGWHGNWNIIEGDSALSATYHDSAAVILKDGLVVAAIEEERLNRIKHSNYFPARAIRHCLSQARATIHDLDAIALGFAERGMDRSAVADAWSNAGVTSRSGRDLLVDIFDREFQVDVRDKLHFCPHHLAHLYATWYPSGFAEALAVCLDGRGDGFSGLVAACQDKKITVLRQMPDSHSLGYLYVWAIKFLGYRRFDEYKAMGLAPYGNPETYRPLFEQL